MKQPNRYGQPIADEQALRALLAQTNGTAKKWTIGARHVIEAAEEAEAQFASDGLASSRRNGACMILRSAGPADKAYKWSVTGTEVNLRRFREGWRVMSVEKIGRFPGQSAQMTISVSRENFIVMQESLAARYRVMDDKTSSPGATA